MITDFKECLPVHLLTRLLDPFFLLKTFYDKYGYQFSNLGVFDFMMLKFWSLKCQRN